MTDAPETTDLQKLIVEAAKLQRVLETARAKVAEAQAVIDATINDYVAVKNRISALTNAMINEAADAH